MLAPKLIYLWFAAVICGTGIALAYSVLLTMFSNLVGKNEQGWVMGVTGSIMALCFGLTSFLTGIAADLGVAIPIFLAACGMAISAWMLAVLR